MAMRCLAVGHPSGNEHLAPARCLLSGTVGGSALDLVRQAQAGDQRAFEQLMEQHASDIYRLSAAIVGEADARDATQETFVQAWSQLPRLRDASVFRPWLRRICVNRSRNWLRSRSRRPAMTPLDRAVGDLPESGPDFQSLVEDRELLDGAFSRLSADQRTLLALHYGLGYSIAEVAAVLELRVGTAKSRLNAALDAMRHEAGIAAERAERVMAP
jgi:RNA polymerase sigma-70 factor, ECF subfamily